MGGYEHLDSGYVYKAALRPEQYGYATRIISSAAPADWSTIDVMDEINWDLKIWDFNTDTETLSLHASTTFSISPGSNFNCYVTKVELTMTYAASLVYGDSNVCGRVDIWQVGESALRARLGPTADAV